MLPVSRPLPCAAFPLDAGVSGVCGRQDPRHLAAFSHPCRYGAACYRKDALHQRQFTHPAGTASASTAAAGVTVVVDDADASDNAEDDEEGEAYLPTHVYAAVASPRAPASPWDAARPAGDLDDDGEAEADDGGGKGGQGGASAVAGHPPATSSAPAASSTAPCLAGLSVVFTVRPKCRRWAALPEDGRMEGARLPCSPWAGGRYLRSGDVCRWIANRDDPAGGLAWCPQLAIRHQAHRLPHCW